MMKALPSSAARRSGHLSKAWPRAELVEGPAGHHAGGLEPLDAAGAIESYLDYSGHSPGNMVRDGVYALRYLVSQFRGGCRGLASTNHTMRTS
jgi:hypothetical protein